MQDISVPLVQGATSANPMAAAYDSRTAVLDQKRKQEQDQKDNDFHTVVKYASEGLTNEARYYAQQKGLNVPDEVYRNADFASALSTAKDLYDDPIAAQKYATAYMSIPGDRLTKYNAGLAAAGKPLGKDERELNLYARKLALEERYNKGGGADRSFTLSAGQTRFDANGNPIATAPDAGGEYEAYSKAYNAAISSGLMTQEDADNAGKKAVEQYRAMRPQQQPYGSPQISQGGLDDAALSNLPQLEIGADGQLVPSQASVPVGQPLTNNPRNPPNGPMAISPSSQIAPKAQASMQSFVVQTPDGKRAIIPESEVRDALTKGLVVVGAVNSGSQQVTAPAAIPRTPQSPQALLGLKPVQPQQQRSSNLDYFSFQQGATPLQDITTIGANVTNIPAHLKVIGQGIAGVSSGLVDMVGQKADYYKSGLDYLNTPSQVVVTDQSGNQFWVDRDKVEAAKQMGYSIPGDSVKTGPQVPIAQ